MQQSPRGGVFAARAEFINRLAAATHADFPALFEAIYANRKNNNRYYLEIGPLLERWAQLDPVGGASFLFENKHDSIARDLFAAWAKIDLEAAFDAAMKWQPEEQRAYLLPGVLAILGKEHPTRFRTIMEEHGASLKDIDSHALKDIFINLASVDVQGAIGLLDSLSKSSKWAAAQGISHAFAKVDPQGAIKWAKAIDDKNLRGGVLQKIAIALSEDNPDAAAAMIDQTDRFPAYRIAKKMALSDPDAALEWMFSLKPKDTQSLAQSISQLFVQELAYEDPQAAFDNLTRIVATFGDKFGNISNNAFSNFSLDALPEFAAKIDPASTAIEIVAGLANQWIEKDPGAALSWLAEFLPGQPASDSRDLLLRTLGSRTQEQLFENFSSQLVALSSRLDSESRQLLAQSFTGMLSESDDPAATEFFFEHLADSDAERERFIAARYRHLVRTDPVGALEHLTSLQGEPLFGVAVRSTARSWAGYDPFAASTWVASIEGPVQRDHAAAGLAQTVIRQDAEAALAWLGSIEDQDVQSSAIEKTVRYWRPRSTASAVQVLDGIEMDPRARASIISLLEKRHAGEKP